MKYKSDLLVVHLNEFNLDFLLSGAKKYNCKSIIKLLKFKKINTFTNDKKQNFNLDPWVQSVSINTGKSSKDHKILNLGQKIPKNTNQIWDELSKNKINCSVWGSMNSIFKKNKYIDLYFPDPWNFNDKPFPNDLKKLFYLPNYYAKNYLDFSLIKAIYLSIIFFFGCLLNKCFYFFVKKIPFILKVLISCGFKNFILFFFFDLISLNIMKYKIKKNKSDFTIIFLNSLAHFQHNNWDEKQNEKYYFLFSELICKEILDINKHYKSLILFNGFTQKKITSEYLLRPKNPEIFLNNLNIKFKSIEQDMTNGAFIFFRNKKDKEKCYLILKSLSIYNFKAFEVQKTSKLSLFYKIKVKASKKIKFNNNNLNYFSKYLSYFDNKKIYKKSTKRKFDYNFVNYFFNSVDFIKTTGVHSNEGVLLYKNFILKNTKKIENHKIFNLIQSHFDV